MAYFQISIYIINMGDQVDESENIKDKVEEIYKLKMNLMIN